MYKIYKLGKPIKIRITAGKTVQTNSKIGASKKDLETHKFILTNTKIPPTKNKINTKNPHV